jgi:hypothetical protein
MYSAEDLDPYLSEFVAAHLARTRFERPADPSLPARVARRARRGVSSLRQRA